MLLEWVPQFCENANSLMQKDRRIQCFFAPRGCSFCDPEFAVGRAWFYVWDPLCMWDLLHV